MRHRPDPYGLGHTPPPKRPRSPGRGRISWAQLTAALGLDKVVVLEAIARELGVPVRWASTRQRAPLTAADAARIRAAVALARAQRAQTAGTRAAAESAVARDDTDVSVTVPSGKVHVER